MVLGRLVCFRLSRAEKYIYVSLQCCIYKDIRHKVSIVREGIYSAIILRSRLFLCQPQFQAHFLSSFLSLSLSLSNSFKTTAASEKGRTCINHRDLGLCTLQSAQTQFQRYLLPFNTYQNLFKTRGRVCFLLSGQHIKLLPYGSAS